LADAALFLLAYLLGSIPSGVMLARLAHVDVRRHGSGNIGATNVARTAGVRFGLITLGADALKGAIPVLLARRLSPDPAVAAGTAVLAVVGHVFPFTLGFAGGKGVATAFGALCVLCPLAAAWSTGVFLFALALDRRVSFASVLAALAAPIALVVHAYPIESLAAALLMAAIIVGRHRDNLGRLRAGTEPRFKLPKRQAPPAK